MAGRLDGRRIAFLTANEGVEQIESTAPGRPCGRRVPELELIPPKRGPVQAFNHLDKGDVFQAEVEAADAAPDDYDELLGAAWRRRQPRSAADRSPGRALRPPVRRDLDGPSR